MIYLLVIKRLFWTNPDSYFLKLLRHLLKTALKTSELTWCIINKSKKKAMQRNYNK